MATTEITLAQAKEYLVTLPVEAMLSVAYDDDRVYSGGGRNEYWMDDESGEPVSLRSPWDELRAAAFSGKASKNPVTVRLQSASRGINAICRV